MGSSFWMVFAGLCVLHMFTEGTEKVCLGTDKQLTSIGDPNHHYNLLKNLYTNCTYVDGNLELVAIEGTGRDLSFVKDIREVTGYVLIALSDISYIPLKNLRIIRGKNLYHGSALSVKFNYNKNIPTLGLRELRFNSLTEILKGNVTFFNNPQLCYENTIDWKGDILANGYYVISDTKDKARICEPCPASCNGNCWGSREEDCQSFTRRRGLGPGYCSEQCDYRCKGPNPQDCCHKQCAVGCIGPLATDCLACLHYNNSGKCEEHCPPPFFYDTDLFQTVTNPDAKYTYGSLCVDECPSHLLQEEENCVKTCRKGNTDNGQRVCEKCVGACPKKCTGFQKYQFAGYMTINEAILRNFTNCTIIEGSLVITKQAFEGDLWAGFGPMSPSELSVFSTVEEITGYLQIEGQHEDFTDLSMFRNLKIIQGRELYNQYSLVIYQTSLESLGLTSLQQVNNGKVNIQKNRDLCYNVEDVVWNRILKNPAEQERQINRNKKKTKCVVEGRTCSDQCNSDGCWGFEASQCIKCANCEATTHYSDNRNTDNSQQVSEKCVGACPKKCAGFQKNQFAGYMTINEAILRNFTNCTIIEGSLVITKQAFEGDLWAGFGPMSPSELSVFSTVEEITGYLQIEGQHKDFTDLSMFRNLKIIQGRELYNQYSLVIYQTSLESLGLTSLQQVNNGKVNIRKNRDLCYNVDDAVWNRILKNPAEQERQINRNKKKTKCVAEGRTCSDQCDSDGCWGFEASQCIKCANFELDGTCVESCEATTHYSDNKQCRPCDPQCDGMCNGPGSDNCTRCLNVKDGPFCKERCPPMKYPDRNNQCQLCHESCVAPDSR
ncbi:epidermal growth factor receptor-like [Branchiostoma floridae]|uniref:receptor protein-tyrosine kinase n=1 Tax=Branchiostoma floridae TaxID=7739 RepID=A0A9J7HNR1_BRAFL|nr:epidermal growth factor receptor-like [Branchiostoma floridae]